VVRSDGIPRSAARPEGDLTLRIGPNSDGVVLGAHALAEALAEANRLLSLH